MWVDVRDGGEPLGMKWDDASSSYRKYVSDPVELLEIARMVARWNHWNGDSAVEMTVGEKNAADGKPVVEIHGLGWTDAWNS